MRVALINNMNNNFFALARYFRDAGVDAHVYSMPESFDHFHPSADTFLDVEGLDWLHQFPSGDNLRDFLNLKKKNFEEFKEYDILIGCGLAPAFLARKGIQIDIFIPFGWELMHSPFPQWNLRRPFVSLIDQWRGFWLRKAFKNSQFVIINDSHELYRKPAKKLGLNCVNIPIPIVYNQETFEHDESSYLSQNDFILFYHGRQLWASNPDNLADFDLHGGNKRNDRVIKAFAQFTRQTNYKKPVLVMFEYGPDIEASKKLIKEQGITDKVIWRPLSQRKKIVRELSQADLATEYFRANGCGIGGTGLEAMAHSVPLLTHTNGAIKDITHHLHKIPIIDVLTTKEILSTLCDYEKHPNKYKKIGESGRQWYDQKHGKGSISLYLDLFDAVLEKKRSYKDYK